MKLKFRDIMQFVSLWRELKPIKTARKFQLIKKIKAWRQRRRERRRAKKMLQ